MNSVRPGWTAAWALASALSFAWVTAAHEDLPVMGPAGTQGPAVPAAKSSAAAMPRSLPLKPARTLAFETDEGSWMSLDVSPDGKAILFDLLGDIYRVDIAGGAAVPLLTGMAFESQPVYSPDGARIAFISDRDGNENVWIAAADGRDARALSDLRDNTEFTSPEWSADGMSVLVSRIRPEIGAFELWRYDAKTGRGTQLTQAKSTPTTPHDFRMNAVGATETSDGKSIHYARKSGTYNQHSKFPMWSVVRRDLQSGEDETVVSAQGSAMRPVLSGDGRLLVYATRMDSRGALRLRDLATGEDRLLTAGAQLDQQEAWPTMDLVPRHDFTPDAKAVLFSHLGKIKRIDIATGIVSVVPFKAHVKLDVGPSLRLDIAEETGPVRARLIQTPTLSPDGKKAAFSALANIYVMKLDGTRPRRLTGGTAGEFHPAWSPDGGAIAFVTWDDTGGHLWKVPVAGGAPRRLTAASAFYTRPAFSPDGKSIYALRSSTYDRLHVPMEYGPYRQCDLVRIDANGGAAVKLVSGTFAGPPQFTIKGDRIYLHTQGGLISFALDGSDRRTHLSVSGPSYYFLEGRTPVDDLRISPDGRWALAMTTSQAYVVRMPKGKAPTALDVGVDKAVIRKLTKVGADFVGWGAQGREIHWAIGSTLYRVPFDSAAFARISPEPPGVTAHPAIVEVPRDIPNASIVLRGATAITMKGNEVIDDADVLVVRDRIAAIGARGSIKIPANAEVRDVSGKFLTPGLIDTHGHWADIRRDVLEPQPHGFAANLAYGVTAGLDPSTLSIDTLAYQDLIEAGRIVGPRAFSTGPAVFSYNEIDTKETALAVVRRYKEHYRVANLKQYRVGNRAERQLVAEAARELRIMPTTEGANNFKLDLTQVIDGFAASEHSLPAMPLAGDVVALFARMRTGYSPTLLNTNGGAPGLSYFFTRRNVHDDAKARRFFPHYVLDMRTRRQPWYAHDEFTFPLVAAGAARVQRAGGLIGVGSHSELQGVSVHWEMQALAMGGFAPAEVLHAATIGGADVIGRKRYLGSLEPGKLADILVLDKNPLEAVANAMAVAQVMKNGRLYDAGTLDELWPRKRPMRPMWFRAENATFSKQGLAK